MKTMLVILPLIESKGNKAIYFVKSKALWLKHLLNNRKLALSINVTTITYHRS